MRILVIDDNKIALEAMHRLLKGLGHKVFTAISGIEGVLVLDLFPCDLVITDFNLPDIDGREVLRRIRKRNGPRIPVVLVSGLDIEDEEFDACLPKPISATTLINVISRVMRT